MELHPLFRATVRGAVAGGKKALLTSAPLGWLEPLVLLDSAVTSPVWGTKAVWWKRWLHSRVPSSVFDAAFFEMLSRQKSPRGISPGGLEPAYGIRGSGKNAGVVCIKLAKPAGDAPLQRMVRTADGRELLQHLLIKEQEEKSDETTSVA